MALVLYKVVNEGWSILIDNSIKKVADFSHLVLSECFTGKGWRKDKFPFNIMAIACW